MVKMTRCSVCRHPKVNVINELMLTKEMPLIRIAREFKLGRESVRRHYHNCLSKAIKKAEEELLFRQQKHIVNVAEVLEDIISTYRQKIETGGLPAVLKAIELYGRITGQFDVQLFPEIRWGLGRVKEETKPEVVKEKIKQ